MICCVFAYHLLSDLCTDCMLSCTQLAEGVAVSSSAQWACNDADTIDEHLAVTVQVSVSLSKCENYTSHLPCALHQNASPMIFPDVAMSTLDMHVPIWWIMQRLIYANIAPTGLSHMGLNSVPMPYGFRPKCRCLQYQYFSMSLPFTMCTAVLWRLKS